MYWNLNTKMKCPGCGKISLWNLQTHFMGKYGSYRHNYKLKQRIPELRGTTVLLDGKIDDFAGDCIECNRFFDIGAEIVNGSVERIFILREFHR